MLQPAGTVGCAAGLRASTLYRVCNLIVAGRSWRIPCWDWHKSISLLFPPILCCWW